MITIGGLFKHLAGRHDQQKHGKIRYRTTMPSKRALRDSLKRIWDLDPEQDKTFGAAFSPTRLDEIYLQLSTYLEDKAAGKIKTIEITEEGGRANEFYTKKLLGISHKELRDTAQGVIDDLGLDNKTTDGWCGIASVLLWHRLGQPKNLVPTRVAVESSYPNHVVLYNKEDDLVVDVTASQFGIQSTLTIGTAQDLGYEVYDVLTPEDLRYTIIDGLFDTLTEHGLHPREIPVLRSRILPPAGVIILLILDELVGYITVDSRRLSPTDQRRLPLAALRGRFAPQGVTFLQPLNVFVEQEEADGTFIISDDVFLVFGEGETLEAALRDYLVSLVEDYQLILKHAFHKPNAPLIGLYQRYIQLD